MSELAQASRTPAVFGAHWDGAEPRSRGSSARPLALVISVAVHVAALLVAAAVWQRVERIEAPAPARVRVTMFNRPQLAAAARPSAAAAAAPPAPAPPPRARTAQRRMPVPQPSEPLPEPAEPAVEAQPAAPDAGAAAPSSQPAAEGASSVQGVPGGGVAHGASAGPSGGGVEPPPPISPERRQLMLASYLQELFRSRIAAHFQYPEEAERLGMEGLVVVRAAVLPTGALWSARTLGDCPHRILCAAAERTVRAAAPFPPPPAELGGAISIDVPLNYRLE